MLATPAGVGGAIPLKPLNDCAGQILACLSTNQSRKRLSDTAYRGGMACCTTCECKMVEQSSQCHRSHVVLWLIRHITTGGMSRAYIIRIRGPNRCLTVVSDSGPWITFHPSYIRDRTDIVQRELSFLHLKIHFHTSYSIPTF